MAPEGKQERAFKTIPPTLHLAIIILAFSPIFAFLIRLNPMQITAGRTLFGALGLSVYTFLFLGRRISPLRLFRMNLIPGVFLALHWSTYFYAIQTAGVAGGVLSTFTFPAMTYLMEPFFYGRRPDWRLVLNALWTLVGVGFLLDWSQGWNNSYAGVTVGLVSAILYSFRNIYTKRYLSHTDPMVFMSGQLGIAALTLVYFLPLDIPFKDPLSFAYLIALGILITGIGHTLWTRSLSGLSASRVSLISSITPLYSILYSFVFPGEPFHWKIPLAAVVILSGIYFEARRSEDI